MKKDRFRILAPEELIRFRESITQLTRDSWPEYMWHDATIVEHWSALFDRFPEYQAVLLDITTNHPVAVGQSLPFRWEDELNNLPDNGWDWVLEKAVQDHQSGIAPNTQAAILVAIHGDHQRQGLSQNVLHALHSIAASKRFENLVVPVRPSQKSQYPLIGMDDYIAWANDDGLPFDAWLRVHVRMGGKIVKICHNAKTVRGTRAEWEEWTKMKLPQSGRYIIPGGLNPMEIDTEKDEGIYVEPNVWMQHSIG